MADPSTGYLKAPKTFFSANLIPGANITFSTNLANGKVTINGNASGGGSATNIYFYPSAFATWSLVGGSNVVSIVGLQPANANLTAWARYGTNEFANVQSPSIHTPAIDNPTFNTNASSANAAFKVGSDWLVKHDTFDPGDGNKAALTFSNADETAIFHVGNSAWFDQDLNVKAGVSVTGGDVVLRSGPVGGTNSAMSGANVQAVIDSQFLDIGPLAPVSGVSIFGVDASTNIVPIHPRNNLSLSSDGSGGYNLDASGSGEGASVLLRTNVYARATNALVFDPAVFQTFDVGLLTNSTLVITNPWALTNYENAQIAWHQDTNGSRAVTAVVVKGGLLRTNGAASITTNANATDIALARLGPTGTNVVLSFLTNCSTYVDTNTLNTAGGGGGGGGTFTFITSGSSAGTASTDNTLTLNTTGGNLIAACISYVGGTTPSITENKGNGSASLAIDTSIDPPSGNPKAVWYYWNVGPTVGSGHTFTVPAISGTTCNLKVFVFSRSGGNATYHTGTSAENNTGNWSSSGGVKPGSITPANGNSLFLSTVIFDVAASGIANSASFTVPDAAISPGMQGGYKIKSSDSTAEDPNWTCSAGGGDAYSTEIDFN